MEMILKFVKPELMILAVVLYFVGLGIKNSETIKNKFIPLILGGMGVLLAALYVVGTTPIGTGQELAVALFTAITQGILVAGLSTYVDQLIKQAKTEE